MKDRDQFPAFRLHTHRVTTEYSELKRNYRLVKLINSSGEFLFVCPGSTLWKHTTKPKD